MQDIQLIFSILILIMSVVIHEVSHGFAAYMQGDLTAKYQGRLTLNPIKHVDIMGSIVVPIVTSLGGFPFGWAKPVPFNPYNLRNQRWGELFVAIAGPLSNILIATIFAGIIHFFYLYLPNAFVGLSMKIVFVNLSLAIFNLIPIPPLDGSKVLFSFLPQSWNALRWNLEQYSMALILLIVLIPYFSDLLGRLVFYSGFYLISIPVADFIKYAHF